MSSHEVDALEAKRPALQRTELGPMFHEFGQTIYDQTEELITSGAVQLDRPMTLQSLVHFTYGLEQISSGLTKTAFADSLVHRKILDYMHDRQGQLTTTRAENILSEGLNSGVVMPLQLWRTIDVIESFDSEVVAKSAARTQKNQNANIDALQIADYIDKPHFVKMLHQLAHAPNGYLRAGSADATHLNSYGLLSCFENYIYSNVKDVFSFNEKGQVTGFSDEFLEDKKESLRNSVLESGGCPVRHAEFAHIGKHATRYLHDLGNQDGQLSVHGESLISRGARLVATALRYSQETSDV